MEFYHVLNRGVDKRNIVLDDSDRLRFVHDLYVMNNRLPVSHSNTDRNQKKRDCLVDIHAWCLMNNHYHLLLSSKSEDPANMSQFMKKLNMGYAKYFNEKYQRVGGLWQGKYKKILLSRDAHFMYIPYYIHLNPLDYSCPGWRQGSATNLKKAFKELEVYRWSSFLDYFGKTNFPSLIVQQPLTEMLGGSELQKEVISNIIASTALATHSNVLE